MRRVFIGRVCLVFEGKWPDSQRGTATRAPLFVAKRRNEGAGKHQLQCNVGLFDTDAVG